MKTEIDPYGEEIWEELVDDDKWTVLRYTLIGADRSKRSFSKEEAQRLCDRWNKECDAYEHYGIEKIKN